MRDRSDTRDEARKAEDVVDRWKAKVTAALLAENIRHDWRSPRPGEAWVIIRNAKEIDHAVEIINEVTVKFLAALPPRKRRKFEQKEG